MRDRKKCFAPCRLMGRRPLALLALLAPIWGWGCASGGSSSEEDAMPTPAQTRSVVRIDGYRPVEIFNEPGIGMRTIDAEVGMAWRVLGGVYEQLGIPVAQSDPNGRQLGNPGYLARRVDGERMNSVVDCGSDFSGPLANQYDITLTVITKLTANGAGEHPSGDGDGRLRPAAGGQRQLDPLHVTGRAGDEDRPEGGGGAPTARRGAASAGQTAVIVPGAELLQEGDRRWERLQPLDRTVGHVGGGLTAPAHGSHVRAALD